MTPTLKSRARRGAILLWCLAASAGAHELKPGEQLTFVVSETRPGGEKVAEHYFSRAFPLAQANGMRELTTFKVQKVSANAGAPQGSGLYLWPSREAASRTRMDVAYTRELRPLRSQAWIDLKSIDMQITAPLTLELDRSKYYTAALVWTQDAKAYARQFEKAQARRAKVGARTVLHLPASRYENLPQGETTPPDHVLLVEWPDAATLENFQASQREPEGARVESYQLGFWD